MLGNKPRHACHHSEEDGAAPIANQTSWMCVQPSLIFMKDVRLMRSRNCNELADRENQQCIVGETNDRFRCSPKIHSLANLPYAAHSIETDKPTLVASKVCETSECPDCVLYSNE
jgi:hypothetical protein